MTALLSRNAFLIFLLISSGFLPTACGPKVVPTEMEEKIDKKLSFEEVRKDPEGHQGKRILIGGEIIETRNLNDKTEIEILQKPLGSDRAPLQIDASKGRFFLIHPSFLDPTVFHSGRRITAVGLVAGSRTETIGEARRVYPVFEDEHLYLWPPGDGRGGEPSIGIGIGFGAIFSR